MSINFIGNKNKYFVFSIFLIVLITVATIINGVGLDIQFQGGYIFTYSYEGEVDKDKLETEIEKELNKQVNVQKTQDLGSGLNKIVVSFGANKSLDSSLQKKLDNLFNSKFADNKFKEIQINNVDPTVGKEFFIKCMVAVLVAVLLMIVYIAFRFKKVGGWLAGSTAIVALIHDVIMIYGTFVIFKMPINDFFIAGALLILGYSVNDTIVIYDRIRENKKKYGSKMKFDELVNLSINQSFMRTINTTVTTVLSIVVILVVAYLHGVNSIISFMLPIMVGMISGTYSTICIAGPLWVILKNKKKSKKVKKTLVEEN